MRGARYAMAAVVIALSGAHAEAPRQPLPAGKWRVYWTADGRVSDMSIDTVTAQGETTAFAGSIVQDNARCPMEGQVVTTTRVDFAQGLESATVVVPGVATISVSCPSMTIRMEAFGLPDGKYLMSGRAVVRAPGRAQAVLPFAMSPEP